MDVAAAKARICEEVDRRRELLLEVSHAIHEHPELAYEEHSAHDLLVGSLASDGLPVDRSAYGMATAFASQVGTTGPTVAVLCEYDALPGIGHACGHNVIAAAGLGAGLAAATLADELGGRVRILGTPAEEGGGGKVQMIDRGAFADVDAALMVHPADHDLVTMNTIAVQQVLAEYHGEAAHAAAFPHLGRNALDAAVLGYVNVAALRQHIRGDERVHGVFTDGGDKPNIVPAHAATHWYVRSRTLATLEPLKERVLACLQAGADAAGCTMTHRWLEPAYADLVDNSVLVDLFTANAAVVGRDLRRPAPGSTVVGSTDMGNVSYEVPGIHPMLRVAPPGVSIHTPEFARYAAGPEGDAAVLDGAKAMAMTIVDLWLQPTTLVQVNEAFSNERAR